MADATFTACIHPDGPAFAVGARQTLLNAALHAGIGWPSSCRNGTCRTCICRVRSGQVRHAIEWPGLLPEEKADGWILPCVAHAQSNLVLQRPAEGIAPGATE